MADVASEADPTMRFAVYLPSSYDPRLRWPVAFLMDPRGQALIPLNRLQPAAERLGYVLISSYQTRSDSVSDVNTRALNAMLVDAQRLISSDTRRLYLVGFSGTARAAWEFAAQMRGAVAGIFGAGATGMEYARSPVTTGAPPGLAYFGVMGRTDFNYEETRLFEPWLVRHGVAHRVRSWPGGHAWPPDSLFTEALEWFEARAMQTGLKPADSIFLTARFERDTARAAALERAGAHAAALTRWYEIARDQDAAADTAGVRRRIERLASNERTVRQQAELRELHTRFITFDDSLRAWIQRARSAAQPPAVESAERTLQIGMRRVEADRDDERGFAAQRELEQAFVSLSFYEPRLLLQERRPEHALSFLEVAERIKPNTARVPLHRAYAFVQLQRIDDALASLSLAVARGMNPTALRDDPSLQPLRDDARFQQLTGGRAGRTPTRPPVSSSWR